MAATATRVGVAVALAAVGPLANCGVLTRIALLLAGMYSWFYLDGSERMPHGRFHRRGFDVLRRLSVRSSRGYGLSPTVVFEDADAIAPEKQYIFAVHPHGVMSFCHGVLLTDAGFLERSPPDRRRALSASSLFRIPFWRDVLLALGGVDASRPVAEACLREGLSLTVLPGGEREQLLTTRGRQKVFLRSRKGFCKLSLRFGVPLVPVYCFGETDTYFTSDWALDLRMRLASAWTVAIPLAWGPSLLRPLKPIPTPLVLCCGSPVDVGPAIAEPTADQVDAVHEKYVQALVGLFNRHKGRVEGYQDAELEVL